MVHPSAPVDPRITAAEAAAIHAAAVTRDYNVNPRLGNRDPFCMNRLTPI
jgi:hypothetical protein